MAYKRKTTKKEEPKIEPEILLGIEIDGKEAINIKTSKAEYRYEIKHAGADRWLAKVE